LITPSSSLSKETCNNFANFEFLSSKFTTNHSFLFFFLLHHWLPNCKFKYAFFYICIKKNHYFWLKTTTLMTIYVELDMSCGANIRTYFAFSWLDHNSTLQVRITQAIF
jgi:hypothetical protein